MKEKTGESGKEYVYEKTLLYLYPYIEKMSEAIGRSTEVKAALSYRVEDTEWVVEELLKQIVWREVLGDVKRELREVLKSFSEEEAFLLEYKFFRRRKKLRDYGAEPPMRLSERTFYRRQKEVLRKFSALLAFRGLNEGWFSENLLPMDWVEAVYREVAAGKDARVAGKRLRKPFPRRGGVQVSSPEKP